MVRSQQYVRNEVLYKPYAFTALQAQFADEADFEAFYEGLGSAELKNEFLRVASSYLFLVKSGDWHITIGSEPVIEYLTTSYKVVALFSLIESLTEVPHQDF